jgi:hypothetical protein
MCRALAVVLFSLLIAGCGGNPVAPPPPPPPANTPPTAAITSTLPVRVEAAETLDLAADVQDRETPVDQLTYTWTATGVGGTFEQVSANPRRVKWLAPRGSLPRAFAFELAVTERYQESGVHRIHQVSASSSMLHYNDSPADLTRITVRFITELFSNYSVTPAQAVQDFSDSCEGKRREREDVEGNRKNFRILSGTYSNISTALNSDRTRATVTGRCVFRDIPNSGPNAGRTQRIEGRCDFNAIYERWNWFLCDSTFTGSGPATRESLRFRVPGLRPAGADWPSAMW